MGKPPNVEFRRSEVVMGSMPQFLSAVANSLPSIMPIPQKLIADRNVQNVVLGDIFFKTWYPSFYPEELVGRDTERLYVCRWCFKYSKEVMPFSAHVVSRPNKIYAPSSSAERISRKHVPQRRYLLRVP